MTRPLQVARMALCLAGFLPALTAPLIGRPYPIDQRVPQRTTGSGGQFDFSFARDQVTRRAITTVYISVETYPNRCYLSYWPATKTFYLVSDSGGALGPLSPGANFTLSNSRCQLNGLTSYANESANGDLTVGVSLTFSPQMPAGTVSLWSAALDGVDSSGWVESSGLFYCIRQCSSSPQQPPTSSFASPSVSSRPAERFTFNFSDANGAADIAAVNVLINAGLDSRNACYFNFYPSSGLLYLITDLNGQYSISSLTAGSSLQVGNGICSIRGGDVSYTMQGSTGTLSVLISLPVAGVRNVFLGVQDNAANNSGWQDRGDWYYIPPSDPPVNGWDNLNSGCAGMFGICMDWSTAPVLYPTNAEGPTLRLFASAVNRGSVSAWISMTVNILRAPDCNPSNPFPTVVSTFTREGNQNSNGQFTFDESFTAGTPGCYYAGFLVSALGSYPSNNPGEGSIVVPPRQFFSNAVLAGPRPLIYGTEAVFTGSINSLVRGASGDDLAIDGSNLTGVNFIGISSSQSISNLSIRDVDLQNGVVQASYAVASDASTGTRSLTIASPYGSSSPFPITIADPTPRIDLVLPANPWPPGQVTTVTLTGSGFGLNPKVVLQADPPDSGECLGFPGPLSFTPPPPAVAGEQDRTLRFSVNVPASSSGCRVRITVVSNGLSGNFLPASGRPTNPQSGSIEASVLAGLNLSLMKIFIVHGLGDSSASMGNLARNLAPALPPDRTVDYTYNHTACTSIDVAADALAAHVLNTLQSGNENRVAFVGHSMGGLIIRKMLAPIPFWAGLNKLQLRAILQGGWPPAVKGMATLGTPHLGYPNLSEDSLVPGRCDVQIQEMASRLLRPGTLQENMSPFLTQLESAWTPSHYNHQWFAAAGRACSNLTRTGLFGGNGCPANGLLSDGVVCELSANAIHHESPLTPSLRWIDVANRFQHASDIGTWGANVLCGNQEGKQSIINPDTDTPLFLSLKDFLNAL